MDSSKYFNSCQYSALKAKDDTLPTVREDTKRKGRRRTEKRNDQTDQDGDGAYMKLNFNPSELSQVLTDAPQESTAEPDISETTEGNRQCNPTAARAQDISAKQDTSRPRRKQVDMRGEKGANRQHSKRTVTSEWLNYQTGYRSTYFAAPAKGTKRKQVEVHDESAGGKCRLLSDILPM